jgi:hypothetical protein
MPAEFDRGVDRLEQVAGVAQILLKNDLGAGVQHLPTTRGDLGALIEGVGHHRRAAGVEDDRPAPGSAGDRALAVLEVVQSA